MKPTTIAESIASLRDQLASIDQPLNTHVSTQPIMESKLSLNDHMKLIESESVNEGRLRNIKNFARGTIPTHVPAVGKAHPRTYDTPDPSDIKSHNAGSVVGHLAPAAAVAYAMHDDDPDTTLPDTLTKPESDTLTKPESDTPTKPASDELTKPAATSGSSAMPHTGLQYDEKIEKLQQFLNGMGANLVVDGKYGVKTSGAYERYKDTGTPVSPTAPAQHTAAPSTTASTAPAAAAASGGDYDSQVAELMNAVKTLYADVSSKLPNPADRADFDAVMRNAGLQ